MKIIQKLRIVLACCTIGSVLCANVPVHAKDLIAVGDTINFGSYFNSLAIGYDEVSEWSEVVRSAEYTPVTMHEFGSGVNNRVFEAAEIDGQWIARRNNRTGYTYYKRDPILWRVLHVSDGKAYLLSDTALQRTSFHYGDDAEVAWANASVRSFLNGYGAQSNSAGIDYTAINFINMAFSAAEQAAIVTTTVETEGSADTQDKVFIPSEDEVISSLKTEEERRVGKATGYCMESGYYLRSPRGEEGELGFITADGYNFTYGTSPAEMGLSIVPAIVLDMEAVNIIAGEQEEVYVAYVGDAAPVFPPAPAEMPFLDVSEKDWFYDSVRLAYHHELMVGEDTDVFSPHENMTVGQAVAMAVRVHSDYWFGGYSFNQGELWYEVYVNYAIEAGMIDSASFDSYERHITRAEMAYLFASALPDLEFQPINQVAVLPDVDENTPFAEDIFCLYRAGVLQGNGLSGIFNPDEPINRAEAATIIVRLQLPEERQEFVLS